MNQFNNSRETTWLHNYSAAQEHRFKLSNDMTICEGDDNWCPKYTLEHYKRIATTPDAFIKLVNESIINKLQFDIHATDKANLFQFFQQGNVDESAIEKIDLSKMPAIETSQFNGCYVMESYNLTDVLTAIQAMPASLQSLAKCSMTDANGKFNIAVPIS